MLSEHSKEPEQKEPVKARDPIELKDTPPVALAEIDVPGVTSVAFSSSGLEAVSGSNDHTIRLWDAATGECLRELKGHTVKSVAFSPSGLEVVSQSYDNTLRLWNLKPQTQTDGHLDEVDDEHSAPRSTDQLTSIAPTEVFFRSAIPQTQSVKPTERKSFDR